MWVQVSKYTDQSLISPQQPLNDQSPMTNRVVACKSKKKARRMMNDLLPYSIIWAMKATCFSLDLELRSCKES